MATNDRRKMLVLLRQGKISKWFSGIGQEAIAAGAALALQEDEWIMPLHRNLGVFTARNMPLHKLFMQWQGGKEGYSKGRERSFHFGMQAASYLWHDLASWSPVGNCRWSGTWHINLRKKIKFHWHLPAKEEPSEGDFHEALNVAAVWDLPVIF